MAKNNVLLQFVIFGCFLLTSTGVHAQDKKVLDDYLLRWVRYYWTCSATCPAIRTKIQYLINQGANPNAESIEHKTPIIYAVEIGSHHTKENLKLVSLLLQNGADPNFKTPNGQYPGRTALMLASRFFNNRGEILTSIVRELVLYKADVNAQDNDGFTPLIVMAGARQPQSIQVLLDNGADVNHLTKDGKFALSVAIDQGDADTVRLLLDHGADTSMKNERGLSMLNLATVYNNKEVQDLLLNNKKNIDLDSTWAAIREKNSDLLKKMIEAGADVNALEPIRNGISIGGRNCLLIEAAYNNDIDSVKVLLEHGADIDKKGYMDKTAFLEAVELGYLDIADLLIEKGADMQDHFTGNWNGLPVAAQKGYLEIVKKMVEKGSPVDSRGDINESSATALMLAAQAGHLDIVKFLVEHGADINATSHDFPGDDYAQIFIGTPLDWAQKGGHQDVVDYLISKGAKPLAH